jgi:serine/threonine-protein phosphatase 5
LADTNTTKSETEAEADDNTNNIKKPASPKTNTKNDLEFDDEWMHELHEFQKTGKYLPAKYTVAILLQALKIFQQCKNIEFYEHSAFVYPTTVEDENENNNTNNEESISSEDELDIEDDVEQKETTNNNKNKKKKTKSKKNSCVPHITICGDIHGQYYDYLHIFRLNGYPSTSNPYVFNGDFVDRGSWSLEVILSMLCFKILYPSHFHMIRGNHETINMNNMYGFKGEVEHKYKAGGIGKKLIFDLFTRLFNLLPLGYDIGHRIFICHGGLCKQENVLISDIQKLNRNCQPSLGIMSDLLWSDPQDTHGYAPSKRGGGTMFGPDITKKFLDDNGFRLLVRSHEVQEEGYKVAHNGKCVTIFSAPNYVDQMGNKAAFIVVDEDYKPHYTQFTAQPHPNIKPMAYGGGMFNFANFM